MPCEYSHTVHFLNFANHGGKHFSSGFLCAFRFGKFCKNFHIFSTRVFPQFKELSFNTHNLVVVIFRRFASVEKIFWFEHNFINYYFRYEKDKSISFSFYPPWDFMALRLAQSPNAERRSREAILSQNGESCDWWDILNFARNFFERN